jgi:phosphoribosylaminoimidazole-succinocarboxamide synthase
MRGNNLEKQKLIYEGKAKKLYTIDKPDVLVQEFKDDIPSQLGHGKKKLKFKGKGDLTCKVSAFIFEYLESYHVPTHFIKVNKSTQMYVKKLEMIPIEVVTHNIASGNLCKRYNIKEGLEFEYPIIEYYLKNDELGDPMINEHHAFAFKYATPEEMRTISRITSKVNAILKSFFIRRNLKLVDFKIEFGRYGDRLLLGDEISQDTCRFIDVETNRKLDKDRTKDIKEIEELYKEIKKKVCVE